jgi:hypothetical protein
MTTLSDELVVVMSFAGKVEFDAFASRFVRDYSAEIMRMDRDWNESQESEVVWVEWNGEEFKACHVVGLDPGTRVRVTALLGRIDKLGVG